jgi:hypothetical protein
LPQYPAEPDKKYHNVQAFPVFFVKGEQEQKRNSGDYPTIPPPKKNTRTTAGNPPLGCWQGKNRRVP